MAEDAMKSSRKANQLAKRGSFDKALKLYEKLSTMDANNAKIQLMLGNLYLILEKYAKALEAYRKVIFLSGNHNPHLWYGLGLLFYKFKQYERAETALRSILDLDSEFEHKIEVFAKLAEISKMRNDFRRASKLYEKVIQHRHVVPQQALINMMLQQGECLVHLHELPRAICVFENAVEEDMENFKAFEFLGWAHYLSSKFKQALICLRKAYKRTGENYAEKADVAYLLARCHLSKQNLKKAKRYLGIAYGINPNCTIYNATIGILYAMCGQYAIAEDFLMAAAKELPNDAQIRASLGRLYQKKREPIEAESHFSAAIEIRQNNVDEQSRLYNDWSLNSLVHCSEYYHPHIIVSLTPFSSVKDQSALPQLDKNLGINPQNVELFNQQRDEEGFEFFDINLQKVRAIKY